MSLITKRFTRREGIALCIALLIAAVSIGASRSPARASLYVQPFGSAPRGLYRVSDAPVSPGAWIAFDNPWHEGPSRLIKRVAATAGDRVSISPLGVFVNGRKVVSGSEVGSVRIEGTELVEGEVVVVTGHSRSLDSRVYGVVSTDRRGVDRVVPLFVTGGP